MNTLIKTIFLLPVLVVLYSCSDYDHKNPDAKPNREAFKRFFNMDPVKRKVTGIYFLADEWGGNATYVFAFHASNEIVNKIISDLKLKESSERKDYYEPGVTPPLAWWNRAERNESKYYASENQDQRVHYHLWYNPQNLKCQIAIIYF